MECKDRRNILWSLATLLAVPLLLGPGALSRIFSRTLRGPGPGDPEDRSEHQQAGAAPKGPRPRINPPEHSVKRRV